MLRIAILDDEELYLEKERKITEKFFREKSVPCTVETFQDVEWFIMGLKEEAFDLYILDVEMPKKNGLEAAKEIRKIYPDPVIIFITNYVDYAVEAYEVNTYRYIPKLALEEKLKEAYETVLPLLMEREERYYIIEKKGVVEKLAYSNIFYLKKEGKYVVFVHRHGESRARKALNEVLEELDSEEFLMVEKGYVANIRHIMRLDGYDVRMRDGTALPIGTSRFGQVKRAIVEFWKG